MSAWGDDDGGDGWGSGGNAPPTDGDWDDGRGDDAESTEPTKDVAEGGDLGEDSEHLDWGDDDDEESPGGKMGKPMTLRLEHRLQ